MADRHWLLSRDELAAFNAHLAYEGARCCPTCRGIYLLEWGACPACAAEAERKWLVHRAAQKRYDDRKRIERKLAAAEDAVKARMAAKIEAVKHSPLWDAWEAQKPR